MFCFGLIAGNFGSMAMETMGKIAGTAASIPPSMAASTSPAAMEYSSASSGRSQRKPGIASSLSSVPPV